MPHRLFFLATILLILGSCSDRPDLSGAVSEDARRAGYPQLVNLSGLLPADQQNLDGIDLAAQLSGRVAALRARAARLQRTVVDPRSRRRMNAALARHNG
ncbi:MAG: hypothetical protein KUG69_14495 [Marinosulfonomonas sp.]|nr:hypothetical protein [Marinosulfonomonas sp.]